jgi:hypothetical protein
MRNTVNLELDPLPVTVSATSNIYRNAYTNTAVRVAIVRVGRKTLGYLYSNEGENTWYVYGYVTNHHDYRWPFGDFKGILGEHKDVAEMARRLLIYEGYITMNVTVSSLRKEWGCA